jgi:hypothetical protein
MQTENIVREGRHIISLSSYTRSRVRRRVSSVHAMSIHVFYVHDCAAIRDGENSIWYNKLIHCKEKEE